MLKYRDIDGSFPLPMSSGLDRRDESSDQATQTDREILTASDLFARPAQVLFPVWRYDQSLNKRFGLVWFHGISTFVGYLTPNPFLCK